VRTRSIQHAVVYGVLCVDCIIWVWRTRLAGRWRRSDHLLGSRRRETLWINIHHTHMPRRRARYRGYQPYSTLATQSSSVCSRAHQLAVRARDPKRWEMRAGYVHQTWA
jgi:hypothetical protein